MNRYEIPIEDARTRWSSYRFVIGHTLSRLLAGEATRFSESEWDEILDIRFFSEDGMLHIFREEDLKAVVLEDEEGDMVYERSVETDRSIPGCGIYSELKIREYYSYDDDGQLLIEHIRPLELK